MTAAATVHRAGLAVRARLTLGDEHDSEPADEWAGDRGTITVLALGFIVALVAIFGLVYDAGGALTDRQRAADIAEQAARAGADVLVPGTGATVHPRIDPVLAKTTALLFIHSAGGSGSVEATNSAITVTVTLQHHTPLLAVVGVDNLTLTSTATASPLPGLQTQAPEGLTP